MLLSLGGSRTDGRGYLVAVSLFYVISLLLPQFQASDLVLSLLQSRPEQDVLLLQRSRRGCRVSPFGQLYSVGPHFAGIIS